MLWDRVHPICDETTTTTTSSKLSHDLRWLFVILKVIGIDLGLNKKNRLLTLIGVCVGVAHHVFFIYANLILNLSGNFYTRIDSVMFKVFISYKISESFMLALWYYFVFRRKTLKVLMQAFDSLNTLVFKADVRMPLRVLCNVSCLVMVVLPFVYTLIEVNFRSNEDILLAYKWMFLDYHSDELDITAITTAVVFMTWFQYAYVTVIPSCASVLFICVSLELKQMLVVLNKKLKTRSCPKKRLENVESVFDLHLTYVEIKHSMMLANEALSFLAFLFTTANCMAIFMGLGYFMSTTKLSQSSSEPVITLISTLNATLVILATSLSASAVKDKDDKVINSFVKLEENLLKLSDIDTDCLNLVKVQTQSPFAFSGWGIFEFDRKFVLATVGNILTYSLLILQINNK